MVALPPTQLPFGANCVLTREIQAFAFHYGLTVKNVQTLELQEFLSILSFSIANPDGDESQVAVHRITIAVHDSPVARAKVTMMIQRLCLPDPYAAVPLTTAPPPAKKIKSSAVTVAAVGSATTPSSGGVASAASAGGVNVGASGSGTPSASSTPASTSKASKRAADSSSSSDDSSTDDDDDDDDDDDTVADKLLTGKLDKIPNDASAMVDEIGSRVSLFHLCVSCSCP